MLMDPELEYYLPAYTLTVTPQMAAWDIVQGAARHWAAFPIMDNFTFEGLSLPDAFREPG